MKNVLPKQIEERVEYLKRVIVEKENDLKNAPEGVLNISRNGKYVSYYKKDMTDKTRSYIKNEQMDLVKSLCQKDYNQRILDCAKEELKILEKANKKYSQCNIENIYDTLIDDRKRFVDPLVMPDEEYVKNWESVEYPLKGFREDAPEFYTYKGERVRSKTEILIANTLKDYNIPYRYECPLYLNGFGLIHPDFTALNVRSRKEFYWEHLGKMDDMGYVQDNLDRMDAYQKNNIYLGEKLILTYETYLRPISSKKIEKMIQQYLL